MWDSPSEYDYGYNQIEDYDSYPVIRRNYCKVCGKGVPLTTDKCANCSKPTIGSVWKEIKELFIDLVTGNF